MTLQDMTQTLTLAAIAEQYNLGELDGDAQVWWTMETGDMIIATDEAIGDNDAWSYAGTVAEMVATR